MQSRKWQEQDKKRGNEISKARAMESMRFTRECIHLPFAHITSHRQTKC